MYQKYEKPNIWYNPDYNEFYTHLGDEHFYAFSECSEEERADGEVWGLGQSLLQIGSECWPIEKSKSLFNNASLVTVSPLLRWDEDD